MKEAIRCLATGFYVGLVPYFPGTAGSLVAFILIWYLEITLVALILLTLFGVFLCQKAEELIGIHDAPQIVFDEFCGAFWATWGLTSLPQFIIAFIFFRFFDILKPYPLKKLQSLPHGWGIMADDLAAGFMTRLLLAIFIYFGLV
ncbi:MAG TPA: phosphatidylglycerophosphatase A [Clostridia bacterium]|nr:phosphatidylglycerophosphatase A [Clostridia bacterium]